MTSVAVTAAGEGTNTAAGGGLSTAVTIALIGIGGVILQMFLKDYLDGRKAKRRHRQHVDDRDVIEMQRREIARLQRELDKERSER